MKAKPKRSASVLNDLPCNNNKWRPLPLQHRSNHMREHSRSVKSVIFIITEFVVIYNAIIAIEWGTLLVSIECRHEPSSRPLASGSARLAMVVVKPDTIK